MENEQRAMYEKIADEMELAILNDTSKLDTKLPSEPFLAESFGVSRPVIREALKILKERGLISSRQGAPTFITKPGAETMTKNINRIVNAGNIDVLQVYQVRIALETFSVSLAANNASDEDIRRISRCNERLAKCRGNCEEAAQEDLNFHAEIAKASKNTLLEMMISSLSSVLKTVFEAVYRSDSESTDNGIMIHDKLIDAIKMHDAKKASDIMRAHLLLSARNYEQYGASDGMVKNEQTKEKI